MKNSDIRSKETDSPKTPGGISKSLLTPIRRLGLSRKWKKSGISPFVSPITSNTVLLNENVVEVKKTRKRRLCVDDDDEIVNFSPVSDHKDQRNDHIDIISTPTTIEREFDSTPVRKVSITRKRSKTLISSSDAVSTTGTTNLALENQRESSENKQIEETVSRKSNQKTITEEKNEEIPTKGVSIINENSSVLNQIGICEHFEVEQKTPNNLSKECIVVIQNNILKPNKGKTKAPDIHNKKGNFTSQALFDSDSDDVPLSHINKKENIKINENDLHNNFTETKSNNISKVKLIPKNKSISSRKNQPFSNTKVKIEKKYLKERTDQSCPSSQSSNSFDDDDDDFEMNKRTILIRKSYDKVANLTKAKSTGSITQKDIDELKARIEMKKKVLLAKAMGKDTEELRGLIKKWQKGCQDALMELLELMKKKLPDRSDMDYSNILQMLKIPPALIGYDAENDCFNTPDDNTILATTFTDL